VGVIFFLVVPLRVGVEIICFVIFEAEPPAVKDLLAPDETVINPYYMRQLLQYGIKLGEAQSSDMGPEALLREAEVSFPP
jgi:CRISPR/Cas system-associated protein Csm6